MAINRSLALYCSLLVCSLVALQGCTYGFLYSDTVSPVDENMSRTLFGSQVGTSGTTQLHDPFVTGVTVQWASRAIGDAAKHGGVEKIQFADMHTISILGGLYETNTVIVYGEPHSKR